MSESIERQIERYRFGDCYPMAIALHRLLDRRIHALVVEVPAHLSRLPWGNHVVHAWVSGDEHGQGLDACGLFEVSRLTDLFLTNTLKKFRNPTLMTFESEREFTAQLAHCAGEDWWKAYREEYFDPSIPTAVQFAEAHILPVHVDAAPSLG